MMLPVELRLNIYEYMLQGDPELRISYEFKWPRLEWDEHKDEIWCYCTRPDRSGHRGFGHRRDNSKCIQGTVSFFLNCGLTPAVLACSCQVYNEAVLVLYSHRRFALNYRSWEDYPIPGYKGPVCGEL
jgi:hypothetical protein